MPQPRTPDATLGQSPASGDWVLPRAGRNPRRYINVVLARWWLIVLTVVLAALAAGLYVRSAPKVYTAEADLLVTPLHKTDPTLGGLGLIYASSDPTRDAQTAARLVNTPDVAAGVRATLGLGRSPASLLSAIKVQPAAQSNIVSIQASAGNPDLARRMADAFAGTAVALRTQHLHGVVRQLLPALRASVSRLPPGDPQAIQLNEVELLSSAPDPTLQLATHAQEPTSPSSPRPLLSFAVAILGAALLGVGGAFGLHAVDPLLRGEDGLRERYRLPVVARIPAGAATRSGRIASSEDVASTHESFRALVATIATAGSRPQGQTLLLSGSSGRDGATTTAIDLSRALASAGHRVLLIDANLLRPAIGPKLGFTPERGLEKVVTGEVGLGDALIGGMPGVELLLPSENAPPFARDMLSYGEAEHILDTASQLAGWVVIDAPPIALAPDALPFAKLADHVLLVVRRNHTRLQDLARLTEVCVEHDIEPTGFVLMGAR